MNRSLTQEEIEKRLKCMAEGVRAVDAAFVCGCSVGAYRKWAVKNGGSVMRKNGATPYELKTVRDMADSYYSDSEISDKLNLGIRQVTQIRRANAIPSVSCLNSKFLQRFRKELSYRKSREQESEYDRGIVEGMRLAALAFTTVPRPHHPKKGE